MKQADLIQFEQYFDTKYVFISGKCFNRQTNKEVLNPLREIMLEKKFTFTVKDASNILDDLLCYGDSGLWPELPIVSEAKKLGKLDKLDTFLDLKQMYIINRLLFHPEDEVLFITTGIGGSGKSTFLNLIRQLFDNDYSSASLSDLSNDFSVAEAVKHRLICSDELAKGELNCSILKTLASKQPMFVNPKHQTGYQVKTQSALFWCCNKAPRIDATDTGILRRIVFYCRDTKIENPDTSLNSKVFTDKELLDIARYALKFEDTNWKDTFKYETREIIMSTNNVAMWMKDNKLDIDYENYSRYCHLSGLKPYSKPNFDELYELFKDWSADSKPEPEEPVEIAQGNFYNSDNDWEDECRKAPVFREVRKAPDVYSFDGWQIEAPVRLAWSDEHELDKRER